MEITSRVRELVKPSSPSPQSSITLNIMDQITAHLYVAFLLFFKNFSISSDDLKISLSKTLSLFYPLAGRLRILPDQLLEIHCSDQGVEFFEAAASKTLEEAFPSFHDYNPNLATLASCNPFPPEEELESSPLLSIQLTRFLGGGACLQVAIQHNALDGAATADFLRAWASFCSGDEKSVRAPCLDRSLPRLKEGTLPAGFVPAEYEYRAADNPAVVPGAVDPMIVPFSRSAIRSLLTTEMTATRFEILAAYLWIEVTRARSKLSILARHEETKLAFALDGRKRFDPPLPDGYLGNCNFITMAATTVGTLLEKPVDYAVGLIQAAKASMTHDYMAASAAWMESRPLDVQMSLGSADFVISSWQQTEMGRLDFGCGKPAFVGSPGPFVPGMAVMFPQVEGDDRLVVFLALDTQQSRAMSLFCNHSLD